MERKIAPVIKKANIHTVGNDFAFWQSRPYEERLAALEEIRREYHERMNSKNEDTGLVQPGFQKVYKIIKLQDK